MNILEAILLGIIQGLTEFLPVSSSGHIELGKILLSIQLKDNLLFSIVVHAATSLSTIVVFRKEIGEILKGLLEFRKNDSWLFAFKVILSMLPAALVGLFLKDDIEKLFDGNLLLVGAMLLLTGFLLLLTYFYKKQAEREPNFLDAGLMGLIQAVAILPGISRSGSTIALALLLGVNREKAARFSFLMVLPLILGASLKEVKDFLELPAGESSISVLALGAGFLAAFLTGWIACVWMLKLVKEGKLIYFAIYCGLAGSIALAFSFL